MGTNYNPLRTTPHLDRVIVIPDHLKGPVKRMPFGHRNQQFPGEPIPGSFFRGNRQKKGFESRTPNIWITFHD